ncbi:MAG: hypothetical protein PHU53_02680 [Thermoplasmata archaeon]|nr:hypothetical protein [Thermoplasmata archaeon]
MKYKYCAKCQRSYIRSRLEGDRCIYCGTDCETIDVKRNGLYYFGYTLMLIGAASVLIPRFMTVTGPSLFVYTGIAVVVAGAVFVVMGSTKMAKTAEEMALSEEKE